MDNAFEKTAVLPKCDKGSYGAQNEAYKTIY